MDELQPGHMVWQCYSVLMAAESSSSDFPEQLKPGPTYLFQKRKFGKRKLSDPFDWIRVTSMNGYIMMLKNMLLYAISV